ncbi:hypothetical protein ABLE92_07890 [Gordonia sp. VNQ95]|uniref:hypothetical protein n=1 Tax=Gordonia sp. VNQ95 TaxID=3156619 RepID=UPI0032B59778
MRATGLGVRSAGRFTRAFDDIKGWLAAHCPISAVAEFTRVAWRTVSMFAARVADGHFAGVDGLDEPVNISIDDIVYRKDHRYLI